MGGVVHKKVLPFAMLLQARVGSYDLEFTNQILKLEKGGILFVPANTEIHFEHHDGPHFEMEAHWIYFRFSLHRVLDYLSFYDIPNLMPELAAEKLNIIFRKVEKWGGGTLPFEQLAEQHAQASSMLQTLISVSKRNEDRWLSMEHTRLYPVLQYIQKNLARELTIDSLARISGLSPSRFHTLFNQDFSCSPMQYVKTQRLEVAARLMVTGDHKLAMIAEQTGFNDAFHLSHAFKKQFEISPREYRKQAAHLGF